MKNGSLFSLMVIAFLIFIAPNFAHALEIVGYRGNQVIVKADGPYACNMVRHVQELKYCSRNTTQGIIFWKKEKITFPSAGTFYVSMDLSKAKSSGDYCVTIVDHSKGNKIKAKCRIVNGQFAQ